MENNHPALKYWAEYHKDLPELSVAKDPSSGIYLYADDSKIYKFIHNRSDEQKLQSVMNLIKIMVE